MTNTVISVSNTVFVWLFSNLCNCRSLNRVHQYWLSEFQLRSGKTIEGKQVEEKLADHMLVLMVKGLFTTLDPYVQFPCCGLSGDQMYDPFWEAVGRLERYGFRVLFRLHDPSPHPGEVYRVPNTYSDDRHVYFPSDPPHLIKTVRNAWSSCKRKLWISLNIYLELIIIIVQCRGKYISWGHLITLSEKNRSESGLALIPMLKFEHLHLTNFSKMRVDLGAQANTHNILRVHNIKAKLLLGVE